jgi:hypothetical protein
MAIAQWLVGGLHPTHRIVRDGSRHPSSCGCLKRNNCNSRSLRDDNKRGKNNNSGKQQRQLQRQQQLQTATATATANSNCNDGGDG